MRITAVRVRTALVPDEDLIAGVSERQAAVRPIVTLRVQTDDGLEGIGIAFSLAGNFTRPLALALEELAELIVGDDPARIEDIAAKLRRYASTFASSGVFLSALSAIDCALWDIKGKSARQPLWRLLGGVRQRVPAYASGQLHRGVADADLPGAAERIVSKGFKHIKLHLGLDDDPDPAREVERAALVRRAVGPQVRLMARRQRALVGRQSNRYRPATRGDWIVLPRGPDPRRRLRGTGADRRGLVDTCHGR